MSKTVAIVSGGMDSVAMAYLLSAAGHELDLVSFDYGQRHSRELHYARLAAEALGCSWRLIDLLSLSPALTGSALTDDRVDVPDGHYAAETMRATVVPNRNMIMLAIAGADAVARGADAVATAVHAGDHFIYPDCRPDFIDAMTEALRLGNRGFAVPDLQVLAPFVAKAKADIVTAGAAIGVPWADTWSCYRGMERHCGSCGTCVERREAFALAGVEDPTPYERTPAWQ